MSFYIQVKQDGVHFFSTRYIHRGLDHIREVYNELKECFPIHNKFDVALLHDDETIVGPIRIYKLIGISADFDDLPAYIERGKVYTAAMLSPTSAVFIDELGHEVYTRIPSSTHLNGREWTVGYPL